MMCGFLLARAGVDVTVLEKHKDFLRDFRGDTVHPSTLQVMHELGLLEEFLKLPHTKIRTANLEIGDEHLHHRRFHAPAHGLQIHRPDAAMGLSGFPGAARRSKLPNFHLLMETEAKDLRSERRKGRPHLRRAGDRAPAAICRSGPA